MPDPERRAHNERIGTCLMWLFLGCALAYGLFLLVAGVVLSVGR